MHRCSPVFCLGLSIVLLSTALAPADDLIKNGSFDKNADGWVNQVKDAEGVVSEWLKDGGREGSGGIHIRSEKGGEQAIWIWRYVLADFPAGKTLRFSAWVKGRNAENLVAMCLQGWDADQKNMVLFTTTQSTNPLKGDFDWTRLELGFVPTRDIKQIHLLIFLSGKGEVWFDDVSAVAGDRVVTPAVPNRPTVAPGLFEVRGAYKLIVNADSPKPVLLIPLPLCYREQVPLTYELFTEPADKLAEVRVYEDEPGNYVAEVTLSELAENDAVSLKWRSIVLCGPRSFDDVPKTAALPGEWPAEARPWLADTRCVQAKDVRIRRMAKKIRGDSTDVMEIIARTLERTRKIYAGWSGRCTELDAVQALKKQGSCTSCANLVAALLRANGIPARILAGYPAWSGPLQTHYIVEAWVPGYGWYPIESTRLMAPWQPYQQIEVAVIPTRYEDRSKARPFAAGGVPYLSLTEYPEHDGSFMGLGAIVENQGCDHEAKVWRAFPADAPAADWQAARDRAAKRWQAWLRTLPDLGGGRRLATPLSAEEITAKSPAELAKSLAE